METISKALLIAHISAGFISLVLFWLPVFLQKGGKGHRITGKAYVLFMWVVVATAALLSVKNLATGRYFLAAFLGFIALMTGNALWYGMAILRKDIQQSAAFHWAHTAFDAVIVLCSGLLLGYGIFLQGRNSAVLLIIFGAVGLTTLPSLIRKLRNSQPAADRIRAHMVNLLSSGIAAYTAFLVFGVHTWLQDLLPGLWVIVPWVGPGVIGVIGISRGVRYFQNRGLISSEN